MIDQSRVTSGFDVEFLMGAEFIRGFLMTALETGAIPWATESNGTTGTPPVPYRTATIIHPPFDLPDRRLYRVWPDFDGHEHPWVDIAPAYSARADELSVTIRPAAFPGADISVRVYPTVLDLLATPVKVLVGNIAAIDLALGFAVESTPRADGLLADIGIRLTLLDIGGPLVDYIDQQLANPDPPPLPTRADILAQLKRIIDRRVPFSVSGGGALQRIATRVFPEEVDHPAAIGVYIDLALRNGPAPTDILTTMRGDVADAQNFIEIGKAMSFAMPATTFALLGDDLTFKMAKEKDGSPGEYDYPLMDGDERVGTIYGITVRPGVEPTTGVYTDDLVIDVSGEYSALFDPDFRLRLTLAPQVDARGVFDFDVDIDLSLSAAATIAAFVLTLAVAFVFPQLGLPLFLMTAIGIPVIEHFGAEAAGEALTENGATTSFLDTLPHKLVVESRRWDPLYFTDHRIETGDVDIAVNGDGFAMDAGVLFLGTRSRALSNMVIRSVTRAVDGRIDGLVYRANDLARYLTTDLLANAAAVDRMSYGPLLAPGGFDSHRVTLSLAQVHERMEAGDRHIADIDYQSKMVHIVAHQISHLRAASQTEIDEAPGIARGILRAMYRAQHASTLRPDATAQLQAELGRTPTEEEIRARIDKIVADATEPGVWGQARFEIERRSTLDLRPREFAALQRAGILTLGRDQLEIRESPRGTVYYRDYERPFEPNTPTWDNLMSLPRFAPPGP